MKTGKGKQILVTVLAMGLLFLTSAFFPTWQDFFSGKEFSSCIGVGTVCLVFGTLIGQGKFCFQKHVFTGMAGCILLGFFINGLVNGQFLTAAVGIPFMALFLALGCLLGKYY